MTEFLIQWFIKDSGQTQQPAVREKYGMTAGLVGIFINLLLFGAKIFAGLLTGAISIVADAFNNLSDAGSSIVTLLGFKLAGKPADEDHPFGHGRIEYLAGLFIAVAIILVGIELLRTSMTKIFAPETLAVTAAAVCILLLSVVVKLWLGFFYRDIACRIRSATIEAAAADSFNDCFATTMVLVALAVQQFADVNIDGFAGMLVAGYIFYSGVIAVRDTLQPLLGTVPDPEFVKAVEDAVCGAEKIEGVHDLIIHDYGPGRRFLSLHAEVAASMNIMAAHEVIDRLEYRLQEQFHCQVTVHMDPIDIDDPETIRLGTLVAELVHRIDPQLSMHDFRLTHGGQGLKLIFDVMIPNGYRLGEKELRRQIRCETEKLADGCSAVIRIERTYS